MLVVNYGWPCTEEKYDAGSHHADPVTAWIQKRPKHRRDKQSASCSPPALGGEPLPEGFELFTGHYLSPC